MLAAIGVLIPWFRGEVRNTRERLVWSALMLLFVGIELWSIYRADAENEEEQKHSWCLQEQRFDQVYNKAQQAANAANDGINEMRGLMNSSQRIESTTEETLKQETGNHQFCMLKPGAPLGRNADGKEVFRMEVVNWGTLPLNYCNVFILDASPVKPDETYGDAMKRFQGLGGGQLGPLPPGRFVGKPYETDAKVTNILLPEGAYLIDIHTRNDRFTEDLNFDPIQQMRIKVSDDNGKIIYSDPKSPGNGKPK